MSYLRLPEALRVLLRHGGVVVVAVEPDRTCAVIVKGPKRDIARLSRARGVRAHLSPSRRPPDALIRLTWVFDGPGAAVLELHSPSVNGWFLARLTRQRDVMVYLLDDAIEPATKLSAPWSEDDRRAARKALETADEHLRGRTEERNQFFLRDPMFHIQSVVVERHG